MASESQQPAFFTRLHRALGPLAGGLLLDAVDLATLGPIGLVLGPFLGFATGLWICSVYRFSLRTKLVLSVLAGIYCMVPMTEALPLATLVAAGCRFFERPARPADGPSAPSDRKTVESRTVD